MPKTNSKWRAKFNIRPHRILVSKVLNSPDITLVTESDGSNTRIISIEIMTPILSFFEAMHYSQQKANRCADILSFISNFGVSCSLTQMNEIGDEDGLPKTGVKTITVGADIEAPKEVDLTKPAFLRTIQGKDEKLARQLSHYRRAILSLDVLEQIREYYQVIEDEYGLKDTRTEKYKYVRDLVSHPELNHKKAKATAIQTVGRSYLDPSEPNDISALSTHLENIKTEARHIIELKM